MTDILSPSSMLTTIYILLQMEQEWSVWTRNPQHVWHISLKISFEEGFLFLFKISKYLKKERGRERRKERSKEGKKLNFLRQ